MKLLKWGMDKGALVEKLRIKSFNRRIQMLFLVLGIEVIIKVIRPLLCTLNLSQLCLKRTRASFCFLPVLCCNPFRSYNSSTPLKKSDEVV